MNVAPVRERGLKYRMHVYNVRSILGRSRKGAWIEMSDACLWCSWSYGRSRKGAWIEIMLAVSAP